MSLTADDIAKLLELPFNVYSPSRGGGAAWRHLIEAGLISVRDVGSDEMQETILRLTLTGAGGGAVKEQK